MLPGVTCALTPTFVDSIRNGDNVVKTRLRTSERERKCIYIILVSCGEWALPLSVPV